MITSIDPGIVVALLTGFALLWIFMRSTREAESNADSDGKSGLYHQLFEQATDSIIITDFDGKILNVNKSLSSLLGYAKEELLGTHISAYVEPGHLRNEPLKYSSLNEGEHIFNERPMLRKDGSVVWVDANVKKFTDKLIVAIARDITDRKRIEAELLESETKFRDLAEKSMVGFYVVQDGKFQYVNRRFAQIFGYTELELINTFPVETVIAEEDRHITQQHIKARMEGITDSVHYEVHGCRKDKSKNVVEIYGNVTQYNGRIAIIGSVLDNTEKRKADDLVRRERNFSNTIIRTLPGIFIVRNMEGQFLKWNKNFEQLMGASEKEIVNSAPYSFIIPQDRERVKSIVKNLHEGGNVASIETELIRKDGSTVPVYITGASFNWEDQQCVVATAIDISWQREAERKLILSEQKYKLLFESNPLPLFMASKSDMSIIAANAAACILYGYTKEELLNMSFRDLKPEEDMGQLLQNFNKETAQPGDLGIRRHKKKDGSIIFVQVIAQDINYGGQQVRLTLSHDVTRRLRDEKELTRSRANLHSILNTTDVGYVLFDKDLKLVTFNQAAFEFCQRELKIKLSKGDYMASYISEDNAHSLEQVIANLRQGTATQFECAYDQPNATTNWYQIKLIPVIDSDTFLGLVASIDDITKRKEAEMHREKIAGDLLQRNQDLEQFTYIVSHNLRAPVANIMGICNILENKNMQRDARLHFENILSVSIQQLDSVIKDLNEILQAGRDVTEKKTYVDLAELVESIKSSIQTLIDEENVRIISNFSEVSGLLTLRTYLYSILYNLIINGVKFRSASHEPLIEITSFQKNNSVFLHVKDNGIGIDLNKHGEEIFGLYNRFHLRIPGKGMGLYMVKMQVQLLGGNIRIKSAPDHGAEFIIELPNNAG